MYNIRDFLSTLGTPVDDQTLHRQLLDWESEVDQALRIAGKANDPSVRFSGTLPMHLLKREDSVRLMGKYREIIGLNQVLSGLSTSGPDETLKVLDSLGFSRDRNRQITNVWKQLSGERMGGRAGVYDDRNRPYGRFLHGDTDSLLGRIYSSINLQFYARPTSVKSGQIYASGLMPDHFAVGSIPRLETYSKANIDPKTLGNKRLMVFDIETAGFRSGSIREVAYDVMKGGVSEFGSVGKTITMRPPQGRRGMMFKDGNIMNVDEFISGRERPGRILRRTRRGTDFINEMMPFLEQAREVDYLLGHNIEGFDIGQIFEGLAGTKKYARDENFRHYIDETYKMVSAKTIDTLRMAREAPNLKGLTASKLGPEIRPYSIENLLLKTDLAQHIGIEKIAKAMGYDEKLGPSGGFTKGLHFGDVDALITTGLFENLQNLRQVNMTSVFEGPQKQLARLVRKQIVASAALTPLTGIRNRDFIHPKVRSMLGPGEAINPLEQEMLFERELGMASERVAGNVADGIPSAELRHTLGGFDRLIGRGDRSFAEMYDIGAKPERDAFDAYRSALGAKGMPFAGLSFEERMFGTGLSNITGEVAYPQVGSLARESMVSGFRSFDPTTMEYMTGSGKMTLPSQFLEKAGVLNRGSLLELSIVEPTELRPNTSVNLAFKFENQSDLRKVMDLMEGVNNEGIERFAEIMGTSVGDPATREAFSNFKRAFGKEEFAKMLNETARPLGVSIGQVTGPMAEEVAELIKTTNIAGRRLRDSNMLRMALPYLGREGNVLRTAGAVLRKGLSQEDLLQHIPRQLELTESLFRPSPRTAAATGYRGLTDGGAGATMMARNLDAAKNAKSAAFALRSFEVIDKQILPNLPKIGAGALAVGGLAYLFHRKQRNDRYDVAFDYVQPEPGPSRYAVADVLEARMLAGENGYRRQIDPLATASLTDHLYYSSIGHNSMSWDKNSAIYGGVL